MSKILLTDLTNVDSTAKFAIGTRHEDKNGNIYIYLKGIANTVAGSWVTYLMTTHAGVVTALLAADAVGPVAIAKAAIVADKYGWYQIAGLNLAARALDNLAAGGKVYATPTAGSVDDAAVTGDLVHNAVCTVAEGAVTDKFAGFFINYPFVTATDEIA